MSDALTNLRKQLATTFAAINVEVAKRVRLDLKTASPEEFERAFSYAPKLLEEWRQAKDRGALEADLDTPFK